MKLSVIIVSYNVKHYLEQCLLSVFNAARTIDVEVFVVDNASTDNSVAYLQQAFPVAQYPTLHFIANFCNVGFGRANNQAVLQAQGEYVLFLNPDTVLTGHTLIDSLDFADAHPEAGGIGARMLKPTGDFALESRRGLPTPFTALCKMSGLASLFPHSRLFGRYYMRYMNEEEPNPIDVISGAFFMVPRAWLEKYGAFDEDFFMYGEDIDLSYRLMKSGKQNYYLPTPILHYKGESTVKSSYHYVHTFYEAMLIFFNKHYRHYRLCFSLPVQFAIYLRAFTALLNQQRKLLRDMVHLNQVDVAEHYLFIGSQEMLRDARQLAGRWMLKASYEEGNATLLPEGHHSLDRKNANAFYFVVYDVKAYSYDQILSLFKEPWGDMRPVMGFYYTDSHSFLTDRNIFRPDVHEEKA